MLKRKKLEFAFSILKNTENLQNNVAYRFVVFTLNPSFVDMLQHLFWINVFPLFCSVNCGEFCPPAFSR